MSNETESHNVDYKTDIYRGEPSPIVQHHAKKSEQYNHNKNLPWHQLPGESGAAYSAFTIYLDIGPGRSQKIVSKVLYGQDGNNSNITDWSIKYDWVNRAEAWDRFKSETHIANMEREVRKSEEHGLRNLHAVTVKMTQAALGEIKVGRDQAKMIDSFMDRFGPAKQKAQQAINVTNFTVNTPSLPKESTKNLLDVDDADFEVMENSAQDLIPEKLKK